MAQASRCPIPLATRVLDVVRRAPTLCELRSLALLGKPAVLRLALAAASARGAGCRTRGEAHAWVPRGLGNAGLLLALVLDGDRWPDAPTHTARQLGCSRDSVRRWTGELLRLRLVERREGFLVATDGGRDRLHRCDPLPRHLLRAGVAGRTPAALRAAAVLNGETLGMRANRHGVRSDRERADLAGVHRETMPKARALLAGNGLATFCQVRRGRAVLVRAAAVLDAAGNPLGSHGRPMGDAARQRIAEAAEKRRATAAETGRVTAAETGPPMWFPSGTTPMKATPARTDGCQVASLRDGLPAAEPGRQRSTASAAQVLRDLLPDLHEVKVAEAASVATASEAAAAELQRLAADPNTVPRLQSLPASRAIAEVLAAARVFDKAPKRRAGLALQVAKVLGPGRVFMLALDVLLGRPGNVGAVLLARLNRALAGNGELLTRCRASWPIGRFLAAAAGKGEATAAPATPAAPGFSATAEHNAQSHERAAVEAAQRGDWRTVRMVFGQPTARERRWSPAWLADRSGVPEATIRAELRTAYDGRQCATADAPDSASRRWANAAQQAGQGGQATPPGGHWVLPGGPRGAPRAAPQASFAASHAESRCPRRPGPEAPPSGGGAAPETMAQMREPRAIVGRVRA